MAWEGGERVKALRLDFRGDKHVLNLIVVMVAHTCEYTKIH